jgi:hypothetical protein
MAEDNLLEGEAEQQLSDGTIGLESTTGCQVKAIRNGENHNEDRVDLPTDKKEMQPRRLQKES